MNLEVEQSRERLRTTYVDLNEVLIVGLCELHYNVLVSFDYRAKYLAVVQRPKA